MQKGWNKPLGLERLRPLAPFVMTEAEAYLESITMHGEASREQQNLESVAQQFGHTGMDELVRKDGWCAFDSLALTEHIDELHSDRQQFNREDWYFYRDGWSAKVLVLYFVSSNPRTTSLFVCHSCAMNFVTCSNPFTTRTSQFLVHRNLPSELFLMGMM
jgi:hypothetical protein